MGEFIAGAVTILIIWYIFTIKSKSKSNNAFNLLDEAEPWLKNQEVILSSVKFSSYSDPYLIKNNGATLLVAMGEKNSGERVGFAVEVKQGCGVLSSLIIEPEGIASHHKKAAAIAKAEGKFLINVLNQMAIQHRIKYPQ